MPIIYTSAPAVGRSVTTPEYEKRGIEGQIAARLGELMAVGLPHVRQLAYAGYIFNINAFMYATSVQKRVLCSANWFSPPVPVSSLFTVPYPSLFIAPKRGLKTEDEKSAFALKMGNAELSKFGQRDVYIIHSPTLQQIMQLPFKELDINCPSPPNGTSIMGFRTMLTSLKLITLFLATHTYPAFTTEDQGNSHFEYDLDLVSSLSFAPNSGFRYIEAMKERYAGVGVGSMTLEEDIDLVDGQSFPDSPELYLTMRDMVTVAKPAPFRPEINVGSPVELPAMPGYLFEYFLGCYIPDTTFVSTMMLECFLNSLGDTKEKAIAGYEAWQKGYEKWYKTDAGKIIGHIFLGIKLALQSQARLFLLKPSGRYAGFVLLGHKFSIGINGKIVEPDTAARLAKLALNLDLHSKALTDICKLLSGLSTQGLADVKEEITPGEIKSARQLWREVLRREECEGEQWEKLCELWNKLHFEESFWPMSHNSIAKAISMIYDEKIEIPDDLPLYLPGDLLYSPSRTVKMLATFGPMAPSFIDQKGTEIAVHTENGIDAAAVVDPNTGKRAMEVILVSGKKLEAAINDFDNMTKKRRIRQNFAERAAGFRTIKFNGDARDLIWNAIKTMPKPKVAESKKRGREEGDEEGDAVVTKKGKTKDTAEDFTMDF